MMRVHVLQIFGRWHLGHRDLVLDALLRRLKGCRHVENLLAMLDRGDAPARKTLAITAAIHFIDDGSVEVSRAQEISMQRMYDARFHRGVSGDQRLTQYLSAEHLGCADIAALATKQIELDALELEEPEQVCETTVHSRDCTQRRIRAANCQGTPQTQVVAGVTRWTPDQQLPSREPPLRIVLLGLGTVGLGVYRHLARPARSFRGPGYRGA